MGTSLSPRSRGKTTKDHPHAYGDKISTHAIAICQKGSSPRVWGQVHICRHSILSAWIIPTRMGTSDILKIQNKTVADHPHAYGDKNPQKQLCNGTQGSSPRVWGQVLVCKSCNLYNGIIPTRMGTRLYSQSRFIEYRDHPHEYGDKKKALLFPPLTEGSSPRVWGQVVSLKHAEK